MECYVTLRYAVLCCAVLLGASASASASVPPSLSFSTPSSIIIIIIITTTTTTLIHQSHFHPQIKSIHLLSIISQFLSLTNMPLVIPQTDDPKVDWRLRLLGKKLTESEGEASVSRSPCFFKSCLAQSGLPSLSSSAVTIPLTRLSCSRLSLSKTCQIATASSFPGCSQQWTTTRIGKAVYSISRTPRTTSHISWANNLLTCPG